MRCSESCSLFTQPCSARLGLQTLDNHPFKPQYIYEPELYHEGKPSGKIKTKQTTEDKQNKKEERKRKPRATTKMLVTHPQRRTTVSC